MKFSRHGYIWAPSRRDFLGAIGGAAALSLLAPTPARAANFTFVSSAHVSGSTPITSGAIDTTGATLIVVTFGYINGTAAVTDSAGNTWTAGSAYLDAGTGTFASHAYCIAPATSASHTFTVTLGGGGFGPAFSVFAFSGGPAAFDLEAGATAPGGPGTVALAAGSITPAASTDVFVAGFSAQNFNTNGATPFVQPFSFGIYGDTAQNGVAGHWGAYSIPASSSAVNASWSISVSNAAGFCSTCMAFKIASAATPIRHKVTQR